MPDTTSTTGETVAIPAGLLRETAAGSSFKDPAMQVSYLAHLTRSVIDELVRQADDAFAIARGLNDTARMAEHAAYMDAACLVARHLPAALPTRDDPTIPF
jgi:hypothetical protein